MKVLSYPMTLSIKFSYSKLVVCTLLSQCPCRSGCFSQSLATKTATTKAPTTTASVSAELKIRLLPTVHTLALTTTHIHSHAHSHTHTLADGQDSGSFASSGFILVFRIWSFFLLTVHSSCWQFFFRFLYIYFTGRVHPTLCGWLFRLWFVASAAPLWPFITFE